MKTSFAIALVAIVAVGCAHPSWYQNDPRAAVVGPDYLDYIDQYPRDLDTQYYYPAFVLGSTTNREVPPASAEGVVPPEIQALQTVIPPMVSAVQTNEGKGWPELEQKGMPLFLPKGE